MKKLTSLLIALVFIFCANISIYATNKQLPRETILAVMVVKNVEFVIYQGKEAEQILVTEYQNANGTQQEFVRNNTKTKLSMSSTENEPRHNVYDFRYVYREDAYIAGCLRTDLTRRISNEYVNLTSVDQTVSLSWSCTQDFTMSADVEISGKWLKAVTTTLGASWTDSVSASSSYNITIAPGKKVWLEFTPRMDRSYGTISKYLTTTGGRLLVEERWIDTYRTTYIYSAALRTYVPDGIYTFKEAEAS